jgi:hypothetical protein
MIRHAQRREVEHTGRAAAGGRATTNMVGVLNPTVREPWEYFMNHAPIKSRMLKLC